MKLGLKIQQILLFLVFYFLITLRGDGYFPFNASQNKAFLILVVVVHILIFWGVIVLLFGNRKIFFTKLVEWIEKNLLRIVFVLSEGLILTTVFLLYKNYLIFKDSYEFNIPLAGTLTLISLTWIFIGLFYKKPLIALLSLFVSSFLISIIPISYFPIVSKIGDLIPIISKQLESFTHGANIYQYYLLDNGVLTQAVRQPGTTLSYLPAYILNIDLRWMGIFWTFGTCFLLIKIAFKNLKKIPFSKKFLILYLLLSLILLSPYRINRLDVYEPIFWFLLTLVVYLLKSKRYFLSSIIFGIGIFTQVWFWLFAPFYGIYLLKKLKLSRNLIYCGALIFVFGILPLSLFILRDTNAYYQNVFGYYGNLVSVNEFNTSSFYLTPVIIESGLKRYLTPLQGMFTLAAIVFFLKMKVSLKNLIMIITIAFFLFIQFNSLSWNYMYMDLFILISLYLLIDFKDDSKPLA